MSRPLIRNPVIPISFNEENIALAKTREILIDETDKKVYVKNADGTVTAISANNEEDTVHNIISQADYDALSDEEKNNGSVYLIYDAEDNPVESFLCTITQVEYDALSEEEKNNGTLYFIVDSENDNPMFMATMTQDRYNLLTEEEKNNNTLYLITDAEDDNDPMFMATIDQDQYDKLSHAEKNNNTLYLISDADDEVEDIISIINSEQYKELTDEEKKSGMYFITDGRPDVEEVVNNIVNTDIVYFVPTANVTYLSDKCYYHKVANEVTIFFAFTLKADLYTAPTGIVVLHNNITELLGKNAHTAWNTCICDQLGAIGMVAVDSNQLQIANYGKETISAGSSLYGQIKVILKD